MSRSLEKQPLGRGVVWIKGYTGKMQGPVQVPIERSAAGMMPLATTPFIGLVASSVEQEDQVTEEKVSDLSVERQHAFLFRVYCLVFVLLVVVGICTSVPRFFPSAEAWLLDNPWSGWVCTAVWLPAMVGLWFSRDHQPWNFFMILVIDGVYSFSCALYTAHYSTAAVAQAFGMTVLALLFLVALTWQTSVHIHSGDALFTCSFLVLAVSVITQAVCPSSWFEASMAWLGSVLMIFYVTYSCMRMTHTYNEKQIVTAASDIFLGTLNAILFMVDAWGATSARGTLAGTETLI
jgi:FtsH-binding integral membrane protein